MPVENLSPSRTKQARIAGLYHWAHVHSLWLILISARFL